jgi:hypothetical protein
MKTAKNSCFWVVLGPQKGPKNSLKLLYLAVLGGFSPINHGFDP